MIIGPYTQTPGKSIKGTFLRRFCHVLMVTNLSMTFTLLWSQGRMKGKTEAFLEKDQVGKSGQRAYEEG